MRHICQIGKDIEKAWGDKVHFSAKPYLWTMRSLTTVGSVYGHDSAKSVVLYFLSNASTFRGEQARALKTELKDVCGIK